jgi:hypothetical protein
MIGLFSIATMVGAAMLIICPGVLGGGGGEKVEGFNLMNILYSCIFPSLRTGTFCCRNLWS